MPVTDDDNIGAHRLDVTRRVLKGFPLDDGRGSRITSYNVCYTKLLRDSRVIGHLVHQSGAPDGIGVGNRLRTQGGVKHHADFPALDRINTMGSTFLDLVDPIDWNPLLV